MKKIKFSFFIISIFFLAVSCSQGEVIDQKMEVYIDETPVNERIYFHEEDYTKYFQEMYMLENLVTHKAYSIENDVNFTFNFKKELTPSEVKNIDGFFYQIAFEDIPPIGGPLYGKEIYNMKPIDSITYRIYIEDHLLQYKSFDFNSESSNYYENMTLDVSRPLKDDNEETYIESLENISLFIKNVEVMKPYKGFVICFNIDTYFGLSDQIIKEIKEVIENDIAPVLAEKDIEKYGMNTSALGIIVSFKTGKNKQLVYFNGEAKKWLDVSWQNFDFFSKNQK